MNKKLLIVSFLATVILGMTACNNNYDQNKPISENISSSLSQPNGKEEINGETLKTVIKGLFTGPDQKLIQFFENDATIVGQGTSKNSVSQKSEGDSVISEKFGDYFTEETLSNFLSNYLSPYQMTLNHIDAKMEANDVKITKTSSGYDFSTTVKYTKSTESKNVEIKGDAQFLKDGKIVSFRINTDGGLSELLHNALQ